MFHIKTILDNWPGAKILIMQRNPLDVYASWKKNRKRDLDFFLKQTNLFNKVLDKLDSKSVMIVKYETLVYSAKPTLIAILDFLNEPYVSGIEDYGGDSTDFEKVLAVTGKLSPTTDSLRKPIFQSSVNQWRDILDKTEINKISNYYSK